MTKNKTYEEVVGILTTKSAVQAGVMFGMPCIKVKGKAFSGLWENKLVLKIGEDRTQALIKTQLGQPFDPGMGRPMREWVLVAEPKTGAKQKWLALAEEAQQFVEARIR